MNTKEQARRFVTDVLSEDAGVEKDKEAAMRILRKRCAGRQDELSLAISAELDRVERNQPAKDLADWPGWED